MENVTEATLHLEKVTEATLRLAKCSLSLKYLSLNYSQKIFWSNWTYITKYNLRFATCSAVYLVFSMKSSSRTMHFPLRFSTLRSTKITPIFWFTNRLIFVCESHRLIQIFFIHKESAVYGQRSPYNKVVVGMYKIQASEALNVA